MRVAVISVHGVGDQAPLDTVRRIGDLLQDIDVPSPDPRETPPPCTRARPVNPAYYPFREQPIRVNVRPTVVREQGAAPQSGTRGPFNAYVDRKWHEAEENDLSQEFMRGQLRCYGGEKPEDTYQTVRLEGRRAPQNGVDAHDVHIYEMYWADLSRLKAKLLSVFTELYQVLFHLSSLGAHTVNAAAMQNKGQPKWQRFRHVQGWATVFLSIPIPIINVLMLGVAAVAAGLAGLNKLPWAGQMAIIGAVLGTAIAIELGFALWRAKPHPAIWLAPIAIWLAIVAGAILWGRSHPLEDYIEAVRVAESVILAAVAGALIFLLMQTYNRRRPGALKWTGILAAILLPIGAIVFFAKRPDPAIALTFWAREFETLVAFLWLAWIVFLGLAIMVFFAGQIAVSGLTGTPRDLARRSRWTGRLLLSLPSFVFLVVTLAGWGLIGLALRGFLPQTNYQSVLPWLRGINTLQELITGFLSGPVETVLPIILFLAGLAVLPAIWGLLPVVLPEVFPPKAPEALRPHKSDPLGRWLTLAYRLGLLVSGIILYIAMTFALPAGAALALFPDIFPLPTGNWLRWLGGLSGAAFVWLFAIRGRLQKLTLGFSPILDIMLDVDNWLREHPLDSNPRARICGRYTSLLRYVANWRPPEGGEGYDKIVIIAHSQGTVISGDLLRFFHKEAHGGPLGAYDPQLAPLDGIPIYLFTMGCPLRQCYGLRFPYLYKWARHESSTAMHPWAAGDLPRDQPPNPRELGGPRGLNLWDNAYRSGDYVGRNLWRTDQQCSYVWTPDAIGSPFGTPLESNSTEQAAPPPPPAPPLPENVRLEFCIGAGAHTHYWDETAPMIAKELDRLIAL